METTPEYFDISSDIVEDDDEQSSSLSARRAAIQDATHLGETQPENTPTESQTEKQPEKIDRRTIKRAPWRTTVLEDGTVKYNDKPNDPHYHAKYYHAKRRIILCSPVNCEICGATVSKAHLTRHKQTTKNALNYKTH